MSPSPEPVPSPFDAIPGYRPIRPLRSRGLPRELLAVQEPASSFRRLCVLRVARSCDRRARTVLDREAGIMARLHHPAILPVYDYVDCHGWAALVLGFDGIFTLEDLWAAMIRPLAGFDIHACLFVAHEIFDALAQAHAKGLVHGDLHPANVLLRSTGHVVLRGFRGGAPMPADLNPQCGPSAFCAPEVAGGAHATGASDIHEAAGLVQRLLVGPCFAPGERRLPARLRSDLAPVIAAALEVCLARDPSDRCLRANTLAATFRKACDLNHGRESLARAFADALRVLPPSVRDLCGGDLPPRCPAESSVTTERFRRIVRATSDGARIEVVPLAAHPGPDPERSDGPREYPLDLARRMARWPPPTRWAASERAPSPEAARRGKGDCSTIENIL